MPLAVRVFAVIEFKQVHSRIVLEKPYLVKSAKYLTMKTLREYIDQLDEISRRDAIKYAGATAAGAALGQPKDAKADRAWSTDAISDKWRAAMTSENFPGAYLFWDEDQNVVVVELRNPTNWSPNNVKEKRLHYPKITNGRYTLRLGNDKPISGTGFLNYVPARQFGNYQSPVFYITSNKSKMDSMRNAFINADKVAVRLEVDGVATTIVFHDNPALIQQRQQRQQQQSNDDWETMKKGIQQNMQNIDTERQKYNYQRESEELEENAEEDPIAKIDRLFRN